MLSFSPCLKQRVFPRSCRGASYFVPSDKGSKALFFVDGSLSHLKSADSPPPTANLPKRCGFFLLSAHINVALHYCLCNIYPPAFAVSAAGKFLPTKFQVSARGWGRLREISTRFPWARPRTELRSATQPPQPLPQTKNKRQPTKPTRIT